MDHLATRCPNCATSFRITKEHLESAGGSVRCGSCLNVFDAEDHQITQTTENRDPELISDDEIETPAPFVGSNTKIEDGFSNSFLDLETSNTSSHQALAQRATSVEIEEVDESWAEALLADLEAEDLETTPETETKVTHTETINTETPEEFEPISNSSAPQEQSTPSPVPEEEETGVLDTLENDPAPTEAPISATKEELNEEELLLHSDENLSKAIQDELGLLLGDEPVPTDEQSSPANKEALLSNIEPEPVRVHWEQNSRSSLGTFTWSLLIVVATLGGVIQYAIYNKDELARKDSYRGYYTAACQYFQCDLPEQNDIAKIRSNNLVVRTHPKLAKVLVVDTIIVNDAPFDQYFPRILLTFSDINGSVVASRVFKPSEYLGGEMSGEDQMPAQQPIHLSLEIVDPGPKAINYTLVFKPMPITSG